MTITLPPLDSLIASVEKEDAFTDLERVGTAVTVATDLGSLGDRLVTHFVAAAREAGCSWSQIGEQLGVSKQAAQQGFVAPTKQGRFGRWRPTRMTDQARAAVALAHEQAHALRHNFIGTEHLLLGLTGQPTTLAGRSLTQAGIDSEAILAQLGPGQAGRPRAGHLPFTRRAKKVLQLALDETTARKQRDIAPEHILLGILREGEGLAVQLLVALGADPEQLRRALTEALN